MKKTRSFNLDITNHIKITGVNIVKLSNNFRTLSVGRKVKNDLFWDALNCYKKANNTGYEINRIKGMQSFILSIEKKGYEDCYSSNMIAEVKKLGFNSLKDLIDHLSPDI